MITDTCAYLFELHVIYTTDPNLAYMVRFTYPPKPDGAESSRDTDRRSSVTYKFSGVRALRPLEMWDDGKSTYIRWGPKTVVAAVYTIDPLGHEALVNVGLRDGRYVVDQIASTFIFRLGGDVARAEHTPLKFLRK